MGKIKATPIWIIVFQPRNWNPQPPVVYAYFFTGKLLEQKHVKQINNTTINFGNNSF